MALPKLDISRDEARTLVDHVKEEISDTLDAVLSDEPPDASDLADSLLDLAVLGLSLATSGTPVGVVVSVLGPMLTDQLVGAIELAEQRARSPERLEARISSTVDNIARAESKAKALEDSPERELFERIRVGIYRSRAKGLGRKLRRLEGLLTAQRSGQ